MRKALMIVCLGISVLLCTSFIGCGKDKNDNLLEGASKEQGHPAMGDLSNLDLTAVEENIALPQHLYTMETQGMGPWDKHKIYEEFPKVVTSLGGPAEEDIDVERDVIFETWIASGNNGSEQRFLPLSEWKDEKIWDIYYRSENLCCSMNASRQVNMFLPDVIGRITNMNMADTYYWMPGEFTTAVKTFSLPKDDIHGISYQLDGEEVFLEDAVAYVEQVFQEKKEHQGLTTLDVEYRVRNINVYQYGDNYGLEFDLNIFYQGAMIDEDGTICDKQIDDRKVLYFSNTERVVMLQKDALACHMDFSYLPESFQTVQSAEAKVDYEKAIGILSGYLSGTYKFKVLDSKVIYVLYTEYEQEIEEGRLYMCPVWHFEISTEGMQQYNRLFIDINIGTGEVVERYA